MKYPHVTVTQCRYKSVILSLSSQMPQRVSLSVTQVKQNHSLSVAHCHCHLACHRQHAVRVTKDTLQLLHIHCRVVTPCHGSAQWVDSPAIILMSELEFATKTRQETDETRSRTNGQSPEAHVRRLRNYTNVIVVIVRLVAMNCQIDVDHPYRLFVPESEKIHM